MQSNRGSVAATKAATGGAPEALELAVGSAALREVLERGVAPARDGAIFVARPVALVDEGARARVRFELVEPAKVARPSSARVWLRAVRAVSLTATLTPCVAVALYGSTARFSSHIAVGLAAALGALLLQLSVNLWNDAEDHTRLIDLPGTLGGAGVIQQGWLTARTVRRTAVALLLLGLALGLPALWLYPGPLFGIGLLALVGTAGYSGWPLGLKYRALGDLTVLALCGPGLTVGFAYAAFGRIDPAVVALGLYFGLAAVAILHVNNWQDASLDRARGAHTVASTLGSRGSKGYLLALYAGAFGAWVAGFSWAHARTGLSLVALVAPLVSLVAVARLVRAVLVARDPRDPALAMLRVHAAQTHLLMGVALCVGLLVARVSR